MLWCPHAWIHIRPFSQAMVCRTPSTWVKIKLLALRNFKVLQEGSSGKKQKTCESSQVQRALCFHPWSFIQVRDVHMYTSFEIYKSSLKQQKREYKQAWTDQVHAAETGSNTRRGLVLSLRGISPLPRWTSQMDSWHGFFPGKVCILTPTSIVRVPVSTHLYSTLITMMSIFIIFPVKNNMSPAVGTFQGLCASSTRCDAYLPAGLHAGRHHYHQPGRAIGCKKSWELKQENWAKTSLKRWEIEKELGCCK
jgi:hypothetical protein